MYKLPIFSFSSAMTVCVQTYTCYSIIINHILATFKSKPKQHICSHKASLSELNYDNDNYTNHNSTCSLNYDMYEIMDQYWLPHIFKKKKRSLLTLALSLPVSCNTHAQLADTLYCIYIMYTLDKTIQGQTFFLGGRGGSWQLKKQEKKIWHFTQNHKH